mgnify:CR=1 FL=1
MSESTTEVAEAMIDPVTAEIIDQQELAEMLLAQAQEQGVSLVGPGGPLNQLTKKVLETVQEAELTEIGPVESEVPEGPGGVLRPGHRAQVQTPPGRDRPDSALTVRPGVDH